MAAEGISTWLRARATMLAGVADEITPEAVQLLERSELLRGLGDKRFGSHELLGSDVRSRTIIRGIDHFREGDYDSESGANRGCAGRRSG